MAWGTLCAGPACANFDLAFQVENTGGMFTPNMLTILNAGLAQAERMWETVLTGYGAPGGPASVVIHVWPTTSGLASASYNDLANVGGFVVAAGGDIYMNVNEIENFANWQGPGANGLNFIDELMAHEIGHVLGIGTLWISNGVYISDTFRYTGQYGLAAYRAEFDPAATWVPVENAGSSGTTNSHWDQRMRSSSQEGDPGNPWALDPRVGVTDKYGRDRALEVMTGAIDPDYLEPFIARFTVESMRDMGYTVAAFEDFNSDGVVNAADLAIWTANFGATGLQIDGIAFGDADRDRAVAGRDFLLWQRAFGSGASASAVPEPLGLALAGFGVLALVARRATFAKRVRG